MNGPVLYRHSRTHWDLGEDVEQKRQHWEEDSNPVSAEPLDEVLWHRVDPGSVVDGHEEPAQQHQDEDGLKRSLVLFWVDWDSFVPTSTHRYQLIHVNHKYLSHTWALRLKWGRKIPGPGRNGTHDLLIMSHMFNHCATTMTNHQFLSAFL